MKKLFAVLILLAAATAHADSIPPIVWVNGAGGTVTFAHGILYGAGQNWWFGASQGFAPTISGGTLSNGYLTANLAGFAINGSLSHISFDQATGTLSAIFCGRVGGRNVRGRFFENVNLSQHTALSGVLLQTPEPGTLGLLGGGLIGIAGAFKRRLRGV
jgi:hypothetical protein